MTKTFKCADMGQDCKWSTSANNVFDLMRKISRHAEYRHDITVISQKLKEKIQVSIKDY